MVHDHFLALASYIKFDSEQHGTDLDYNDEIRMALPSDGSIDAFWEQ